LQVSVVIPTFNCADYLVQALQTVLAQSYQDFEIIVVDDASTDNTEAAVSVMVEHSGIFKNRIHCVRQDRAGPSVARNRGILLAQGEMIAFLDADDLWRPAKLARQVDYMNQHPEAVLVYTDFTRGSQPGTNDQSRLQAFKPRDAADAFHGLLDENFIATSSVLIRREAFARTGLFDPTLRGSEDLDLWLRLARTGPFGMVDEILVDVRQHAGNTTRTTDFAREQIRAARIMLTRWGDDPAAARLIRRRLGICSWDLAFAEQTRGRYSQARSAYWYSACHTLAARPSPLAVFFNWKNRERSPSSPPIPAALARAAIMSLPYGVISTVRQWAHRMKL
jgi:glycosyltransferase involved in cell wall biosynthesis